MFQRIGGFQRKDREKASCRLFSAAVKQIAHPPVIPCRQGTAGPAPRERSHDSRRSEMFGINPGTIAVLIPIVAVVGTFAVIIVAILVEGREKEQKHRERLIAMEKGLAIPEEPVKKKAPRYLAIRAWGLVFFLLGVGTFIGITAEAGIRHGVWGLMPLGLGVALLLSAYMERRDYQG